MKHNKVKKLALSNFKTWHKATVNRQHHTDKNIDIYINEIDLSLQSILIHKLFN